MDSIKGALRFRHLVLGVIAIFFYVGIEIGIPMHLNFYVTNMGFEGSAAIGGTLAASYWFMMLIGRFSSTFISGKVSTRAQMTFVSTVALCLLPELRCRPLRFVCSTFRQDSLFFIAQDSRASLESAIL